jgi:alanine racemase
MVNHNKLYIDLDAIANNYKVISETLPNGMRAGCNIKLNAYGMGDVEVMKTLSGASCNEFFVSSLEEALVLRNKVSITDSIFVWDGIFEGQESDFVQNNIFPVLSNKYQVELFNNFCLRKNKVFDAALLISSNGEREGFTLSEILKLIKSDYFSNLKIKFRYFITQGYQSLETDREAINQVKKLNITNFALVVPYNFTVYDDCYYDTVIVGVDVFGCSYANVNLRPAISLVSSIAQINMVTVVKDFLTKNEVPFVKIPIGLAHGISSKIAKYARFNINGCNTKIDGDIRLDYMILNASKVPNYDLKLGAEVEIIGNNVSLEDMAKWSDSSIECVLTNLSARIKRIY